MFGCRPEKHYHIISVVGFSFPRRIVYLFDIGSLVSCCASGSGKGGGFLKESEKLLALQEEFCSLELSPFGDYIIHRVCSHLCVPRSSIGQHPLASQARF